MATQPIKIPIDRFGRVVLPKEIRDRLGSRPGTEFEVEEREDAILLRPVFQGAKLMNKGGWLVVSTGGTAVTPERVEEVVEGSRREHRWRR